MQRTRNILFNSTFFFNCLLLFLLLFYDRMSVPLWIQVFGRMHPMVLHFPVVLILLYILWVVWFSKQIQTKRAKDMGDILLLIAACSAVITALFGLLLSKEGGYGV